jgi:hypothetical protein
VISVWMTTSAYCAQMSVETFHFAAATQHAGTWRGTPCMYVWQLFTLVSCSHVCPSYTSYLHIFPASMMARYALTRVKKCIHNTVICMLKFYENISCASWSPVQHVLRSKGFSQLFAGFLWKSCRPQSMSFCHNFDGITSKHIVKKSVKRAA